jgi:hypothetical protein
MYACVYIRNTKPDKAGQTIQDTSQRFFPNWNYKYFNTTPVSHETLTEQLGWSAEVSGLYYGHAWNESRPKHEYILESFGRFPQFLQMTGLLH